MFFNGETLAKFIVSKRVMQAAPVLIIVDLVAAVSAAEKESLVMMLLALFIGWGLMLALFFSVRFYFQMANDWKRQAHLSIPVLSGVFTAIVVATFI